MVCPISDEFHCENLAEFQYELTLSGTYVFLQSISNSNHTYHDIMYTSLNSLIYFSLYIYI